MVDLKPNAFTVGNKRSYDESLSGPDPVRKIGRRSSGDEGFPDGYEGGWVWRTEIAAWAWLCGIDPEPESGKTPDHRRFGESMISFEGRPPVLCAVYGLVLPNGWDPDVSKEQMSGDLYEPNPFGPFTLLTDSLIVPINR